MSTPPRPQVLFPRQWPSLPLYLDWDENIAICTLCQYAISVEGTQASSHFRKRHQIPSHRRKHLDEYLQKNRFQSGFSLNPRPHGSTRHPALQVLPGFQCTDCLFCSTSLDLTCRHLRKMHLADSTGLHLHLDHLYRPVSLQSWTQSPETRAYWVIVDGSYSLQPKADTLVPPNPDFAVNMAFLKELQTREHHYQAMQQEEELPSQTGAATYEGTRPWLERTGWITTYQGVPRNILKRMVLPPSRASGVHGLPLGLYQNQQLASPAEDEKYIFYLFSAIDLVLDRCEETMQHTGHHIRTWLKSHYGEQPSRQPFGPLGTRQSRHRYRQTWKKFIVFVLRVFRLGPEFSRRVLQIGLTPQHQEELHQIWDQCIRITSSSHLPCRTGRNIQPRYKAAEPSGLQESTADTSRAQSFCQEMMSVAIPPFDPLDKKENPWSSNEEDRLDQRHPSNQSTSDSESDSPCPAAWSVENLEDLTDNRATGMQDFRPGSYTPQLLEMLFRLCMSLSMQEFRDGQAQSTILVYFSGILGMSSDGEYFLPARIFTSNLSALIYIQRLLFLEHVLPYRPYSVLSRPCRPLTDHLTPLQATRMQYMLPGCPTPLGEFQSLRAFGKRQAALDPPSFFLHWTAGGDMVILGDFRLTITAFRTLPEHFVREAGTLCDALLLGLRPTVNLETVQDSFTESRPGQSFVSNPGNGLCNEYFQLARAAAESHQHGLMYRGVWHAEGIHQYLRHHEQLLEHIAGILITVGGQMPRLKELLGIEYANSPSTERAFYIYQAEVIYLIRHNKSKRYTGHEFNVARFLSACASRILFLYLVYIRPFAELLCREQGFSTCAGSGNRLLFWSLTQGRSWTTANFHRLLTTATQKKWGQSITPQKYRQLSIGITEKHVRGAQLPSDLNNDTGTGADPGVVFAWQSGHRPHERARTYGLDGSFPTRLQPALLQAYARVSHAWHDFLYMRSMDLADSSVDTSAGAAVDSTIQPKEVGRRLCKRSLKLPVNMPTAKRKVPSRPHYKDAILPNFGSQGDQKVSSWPPFLHVLPECRVILCTMHGSCYTRKNISRHLAEGHHIKLGHRNQILTHPTLEGTAFALTPADVIHPADGTPEISGLPSVLGFVCHMDRCSYRTSNQDRIRQHYNEQHQWRVKVAGQMPWRRAFLQTLFRQSQGVKYFTVIKGMKLSTDAKSADQEAG